MIGLATAALIVGAVGLAAALLATVGNAVLLYRDATKLERRAPVHTEARRQR